MNIKELIEKEESETLEFKKSTAQLEKALKSICGFLNRKFRGIALRERIRVYTIRS